MPPDAFDQPVTGSVIIPAIMTHPHLQEFILQCAHRAGNHWPDLYDEMCRSAARRKFRDLGYPELRTLGLPLDLDSLDTTATLVDAVLKSSAVN